jgi:tetratricopeptide (TPR) repeat protein
LYDKRQLDEAARSLEAALDINPDIIDAHYSLAQIKTYREADPYLAMLEHQRGRLERFPIEMRIRYWFALAKIREDIGCYDDSFAAYQEGNRLQQTLLAPNETAIDELVDRIISVFSQEFFDAHRPTITANSVKLPVFIVGMPRSGTSLLEQILASSQGLHGAGELTDLGQVIAGMPGLASAEFPEVALFTPTGDFEQLGQQYIERLWRHAPEAKCITDKMPANFLYIGMIRLMLPHAKIIHAMRDPMDSCFSCYTRLFLQGKVSFSYNLEALGKYYARYVKLMKHWHAVLPAGAILDVRYEDVVNDTEGQARRMLAYLELPWDDRCLAFHHNKRRVETVSFAQVRHPIYSTSVARWERFAQHLVPLWNLVKDFRDLPSEQPAQILHRRDVG